MLKSQLTLQRFSFLPPCGTTINQVERCSSYCTNHVTYVMSATFK